MIDAYYAGSTIHEIALQFGCDPSNVSQILRRRIDTRAVRRARRHEKAQRVLRLRAQGFTYPYIARQLNFGERYLRGLVYAYLRELGA